MPQGFRSWVRPPHLGDEVLEAGNDVGALELLVVAKAAGDDNDGNEGDGEVKLGGG